MNDIITYTDPRDDCPSWCARHWELERENESAGGHVADPFWLRSTEETPYLIAVRLCQDICNGEARDPSISLRTHPESPTTIPIGMSVRQARMVGEALLRFAEQGESVMTERCTAEGCDRMTVPSSGGLCDPCWTDAWRARRPRLVQS